MGGRRQSTFSERQTRHNSEMNHFYDLQANLEQLNNFGHISYLIYPYRGFFQKQTMKLLS